MLTLEEIFLDSTCYSFLDKKVDKSLLVKIYDLMKLGPTSANSCPLRIIFVQSANEKEKLIKCLYSSNKEKAMAAPVTAIFAYDRFFYNKMDILYPNSKMKEYFLRSLEKSEETAIHSSTLQAAYFMVIAKGYGLGCGPMSGFDRSLLDSTFFANGNFKSNFICNLGYKQKNNKYPKLPRLSFEDCCTFM